MVRGASIGIGLQSMVGELGENRELRIHCDSSAALGVAQRKGLGQMRHIDIALLWLQEHVECGKIRLAKIKGEVNPADIFTKALGVQLLDTHLKTLRGVMRPGRAELAPELVG